ncbi:MAG TPA: histidinol-phosphatase HisJ [bacterium]
MIDYHIHTKLCGHATGEMEQYVERAIAIGLQEIGFNDHLPFVDVERPGLAMKLSQLPFYVQSVEQLRQKYPNIIIRLGTEVDYFPQFEKQIADLLAQHPFDYVYGSVHFLDDWSFDSPFAFPEWNLADVDQVYEQYIGLLHQAARSGLFDIMSHLDLVKIYGFRPGRDMLPQWESLLKTVQQNGLAVEINTSGLRKPVGEIYPSEEIVELISTCRIPIVFGSDAHRPQDVGRDFDQAMELALKHGITSVGRFEKRKIVQQVPIQYPF